MTSNLGSDIILDGIRENGEISDEARGAVEALLRRSFRPEFLNRLDEKIFFKPLTKSNIRDIVDLLLADLQKRMTDKRLSLVVTDAAKERIIDAAYDPIYGARPLKRYIQSQVETLVARTVIQNDIAPESTVRIDLKDGTLCVQ